MHADLEVVRPLAAHNMSDPMDKYFTPEGVKITELVHDHFCAAIKLTFNAKHHVSALKLLVCFVDSMAYLAAGDSTATQFQQWLTKYCNLPALGITPEELWEHRNAVLHTSSVESRRVKSGKCSSLRPVLGARDLWHLLPVPDANEKYYCLHELIQTIMQGTNKYLEAVGKDPVLYHTFFANYGTMISDSNVVYVYNAA